MRFALPVFVLLALLGAGFFVTQNLMAAADTKPTKTEAMVLPDKFLGQDNAPVTIIEYASLTCGHCAHFHKEILPKLEEKYINTGKVKLFFRDFPLDNLALKAAQLSHCMPQSSYFPFVKTLFASLENWTHAPDVEAALVQYAKLAGLSADKAEACLKNTALQEALVTRRMDAEKTFEIQATPTFIVNPATGATTGPTTEPVNRITGAGTFDEFEKQLKPFLE